MGLKHSKLYAYLIQAKILVKMLTTKTLLKGINFISLKITNTF
jgi:hypothetical protein